MAQQTDAANPPSRSPREIEDELRMADAGRERAIYAKCRLRKGLLEIAQQSAWLYAQLEKGTLREREAVEELTAIEDLADELTVAGTMLRDGARDRDVHLNDAIDRGLERADAAKGYRAEDVGRGVNPR